ncbi:T9SS type A sorting domain-containing protein [candidate division KSB1 bacterium]|nr:T9SS type A sorting domain-containing protein [candidate division KSB1 bacterium]MBL7094333.1 T9SS type A sorting domain-containing protein [candidate division KSB1 bacterium]
MTRKMKFLFFIFFCLLYRLVFAQTDTLKIIDTTAKIGTEGNLVELYLINDIPIRGIQLTLNYSADISPFEISQTIRTQGFNIEFYVPIPGEMIILIYKYSSGSITSDIGSILDMKFNVSPGALPGYHPLEMKNVYASDMDGQSVELKIDDGVFIVEQDATPVELTSFNASFFKNQNKIKLEWGTSSESNNYGFEIQRGEDNKNFKKIEFVNGNGTTSSPHKYFYLDSDFSSGTNYYRLKQIDFDGSSNYSKTIEITPLLPTIYKLYQNYPNPFNPETTIEYGLDKPGFVELTIHDINGKLVQTLVSEQKQKGIHSAKWSSRDNNGIQVTSGVYFYFLRVGDTTGKNKGFNQAKRMILLK